MRLGSRPRFAAALAGWWLVAPAFGEQADRSKPAQLEADRMSADDARRISIFEGNVSLAKGTLSVRADRVVVRQDPDGYLYATATGNPARFRQRSDARAERPGVWTEAEALRIEVNDRTQKVELFERARMLRDQDEVQGEFIVLDQRTEVFTASAAQGGSAPPGRVRAVIQPRTPAAAGPAPAAGARDAGKPPAR